MKYTITEMKNTLEGINSRLDDIKEQISKLEDRGMENTEVEQKKDKRKNLKKWDVRLVTLKKACESQKMRFWFSRWCPSISYFSQVLQVVRTCNHPNSLWLQKSSAPATDVGTKAERVKGSSPRSPSQWAADPRPALWSSEQNKTEFLLSPSKNRIKRQEERQKDAISHLITSCHVVTIFLIWSPTLMDQK